MRAARSRAGVSKDLKVCGGKAAGVRVMPDTSTLQKASGEHLTHQHRVRGSRGGGVEEHEGGTRGV